MTDLQNGALARLSSLESRMTKVESKAEDVAVLKERVTNIADDVHEAISEVRGLRRALIGGGISFVVGALIFALTATQIWGG